MSRTDNIILLIDDDPSHAKAFEEALIAAVNTATVRHKPIMCSIVKRIIQKP